jgi:hypothetical protein
MAKIGTLFHMTLSFHLKADGRSERTNKTFGQVLRLYTAKQQLRWLEALLAVEFAINSAINVATGFSPFDLLFGRKAGLFPTTATIPDSPQALATWLKHCEGQWLNARDTLISRRICQALQNNKKR